MSIQLQAFWQKTLTSGHSLKNALSPQSSPSSANFPSTKPSDGPLQETFLPVFNNPESDSKVVAHGNLINLAQPDKVPQLALAEDHPNNRPAATNPGANTIDNSYDHMPNHVSIDPPIAPYVDAITQTEHSTPSVGQTTLVSDSESGDGKLEFEHGANSDTEPSDHYECPEIFHGESQIVVTEIGGKKHIAMLVTTDMIRHLNNIRGETSKLERFAPKLEKAKEKVALTTIDVRYCEDSIEEAESQEEIDHLREEMIQRQSTLPEDKKRRDELQERADIFKGNIEYLGGLLQDDLEKVLSNAGYLKTHFEPSDEEKEDDGRVDTCTQSQPECFPVDDESSCTASTEITIDELYRRTVDEEVRDAYRVYCNAEREFDERHNQYAVQKERFDREVQEGACSMTQTQFDHMDFEVTKELGEDMAAAEEAYEDALARRQRLGPTGSDQESGFLTDEYDGYPLSWEDNGIASAPVLFIKDWLRDIPDVENRPDITDHSQAVGDGLGQEDRGDIEECDIRSAQMSDTWSARDMTRNRRRIDRWNEMTGRNR